MMPEIAKVIFTKEEIQDRVAAMGREITEDYQGREPLFVGVLKGSFIFLADLIREVELPCTVDFMLVSSYGNERKSSGKINIRQDLSEPIEGKDVIIVEDVLDSGTTLCLLLEELKARKPRSLSVAVLLDKQLQPERTVNADYVGFSCPNEYIVGYGLDDAQKWRNLPYIGGLYHEKHQ